MRIFILTTLMLVVVVLVAVIRKPYTETMTWTAMGTFASATVTCQNQKTALTYFKVAKDTFAEVESQLSIFKATSDISTINNSPTGVLISVGEHARNNLAASERFYRISGGTFDPTVGPLMRLWGFRSQTPLKELPSAEAVDKARPMCGFTNLILTKEGVILRKNGIKVDLGGIAKGYAVDKCYERLKAMGANNFLVNLGGNIRCSGLSPQGTDWRIAVRSPFDPMDILGTITLKDGMAVGTSGNYEKFVTINGTNYSHIMNPLTGRPAHGIAAVTILCLTATETEGLSKPLFITGPDNAMPMIINVPGSHALFIPDSKPVSIIMTPGMNNYFTLNPEHENIKIVSITNAI